VECTVGREISGSRPGAPDPPAGRETDRPTRPTDRPWGEWNAPQPLKGARRHLVLEAHCNPRTSTFRLFTGILRKSKPTRPRPPLPQSAGQIPVSQSHLRRKVDPVSHANRLRPEWTRPHTIRSDDPTQTKSLIQTGTPVHFGGTRSAITRVGAFHFCD
jgi:hypothetical protein